MLDEKGVEFTIGNDTHFAYTTYGPFITMYVKNMCLETLEILLRANFVRTDSEQHKQEREEYQKDAIIKLKMLGYISMVAENANCILM